MLPPLTGGCALAAVAQAGVNYFFDHNHTCGVLNIQHYMFNMESRHLPNLSVQNALDCISENFNLKNFPGGACPRNSLEKCAAVLMGLSLVLSQSYHILPLYTIPLGLLYQKILRPPEYNRDRIIRFFFAKKSHLFAQEYCNFNDVIAFCIFS